MLEREERACALACDVDAAAVDDGVRAGEVDELEDAKLLRRFAAVARVGANAGRVDDNDLAGADVALKLGADGVERAGFRREDNRAAFRCPMQRGRKAWGSRAAMSFVGEERTGEYAPSMRSIAAETASSMEPRLSLSCTMI